MSYTEDVTGRITKSRSAAHIPVALMLLAIRIQFCNMNLSCVVLVWKTVWNICIGDYTS